MTHVARRMWQLTEPLHAVVYFTPEARSATDAAGLRGFWMGYFASRVAPLGPVGPEVAVATFYGFDRGRAERALPDAWHFAGIDAILRARSEGATAALRRILTEIDPAAIDEAAELTWTASQYADCAGRVLGAGNQALLRPDDSLAALWQATTTLREHRGDGHVACLLAADVSPVGSHILKIASGEADSDLLRAARGWPDDVWNAEILALRERGWIDSDGKLTTEGGAIRDAVEAGTDRAASAPWDRLGTEGTERLQVLLKPMVGRVRDAGIMPEPNPIGLSFDGK
ncbi:SCO6745 family protein [Aldersonia kunmingensis]|uniref:SCO6745 family protein n=1 Tax=Aldersonia kunmingensis TaxID=408066 RepID=UPI000833E1CC|nr:hypothetical protein [Aldersonia kunmingensis]